MEGEHKVMTYLQASEKEKLRIVSQLFALAGLPHNYDIKIIFRVPECLKLPFKWFRYFFLLVGLHFPPHFDFGK